LREVANCPAPAGLHPASVREKARLARWVRLSVAFLVVLGIAVCAWIARAPLLRAAADLWVVSDEVTHADAVAVLGGGLDVRPFAAADLYRQGLVDKVLVSNNGKDRAALIGAVQGHTDANQQVLLKLGVPESAIETFGLDNQNTRDEAIALREWADRHDATTIIVPTEVFAARRVQWIFQREFAEKGIRIEVPSYEPSEYSKAAWWKTAAGLITFQNEVIKYVYYRLKY
jgi:uncharacterized SAM-binding protein YcdF (DUF218 family)